MEIDGRMYLRESCLSGAGSWTPGLLEPHPVELPLGRLIKRAVRLSPLRHAFPCLHCGLGKFFLTSDLHFPAAVASKGKSHRDLNTPGQGSVSITFVVPQICKLSQC